MKLEDLRVKIFADGANLEEMARLAELPYIKGFTTNPTLIRRSRTTDYEAFAGIALELIRGKPISLEVLADDFDEMERQARRVARWGSNVYVKIPITNTKGEWATGLINRLSLDGIKVNVTAVMTMAQVECAKMALYDLRGSNTPAIISVFAGRIADTGESPKRFMRRADGMINFGHIELLWASTREVYNIVQADQVGCDIITVPSDILKKLDLLGKNLNEFSLETVQQFYDDAVAAGYSL